MGAGQRVQGPEREFRKKANGVRCQRDGSEHWRDRKGEREDRKRRFWGRVDAEMREVFRPLRVDVHFTPVNPLQVAKEIQE